MSEALQELEDKLAAAFDTADWSLDASTLPEAPAMEDGEIRTINMDLGALGGSRPSTNN